MTLTPAAQEDLYDRIAMAIGEVCIWWASLENLIHDIVLHLASYLDPAFDTKSVWGVIHITLSTMDSREKIATAKALAHEVNAPDSPDFYERAEALLNYLDNFLRPERNRYIHDTWETEGEAILRVKLGARVHRPSARQRALIVSTARRYESIEAVQEFITNLELAYHDLVELDSHIAWLEGQKKQPGSHLQPLPPEWKSLAHRDWRERDTPPHPPES